jgi:hypothetical protein
LGRIVDARPLAIGTPSSGEDTAGLSGVPRFESLLDSLAGDGLAASGTASDVSRAELADASTTAAAGGTEAFAAGSTEAALSAAVSEAGSAAAGGGATRAGSKLSGLTYPWGSVVTRAPK